MTSPILDRPSHSGILIANPVVRRVLNRRRIVVGYFTRRRQLRLSPDRSEDDERYAVENDALHGLPPAAGGGASP
jgi:hypothetical protein